MRRSSRWRLIRAGAFLVLALMLPSSGFGQEFPRPPEDEALPFIDIIEAGTNAAAVATRDGSVFCNWMQGACDLLHHWVAIGGPNPSACLAPLRKGVELERRQQALLANSPRSFETAKAAGDLAQARDLALRQVGPDCFYPKKAPKWCKVVVGQLVALAALGPDYPQFLELERQYHLDVIKREGFERTLRATIANPLIQNASDLNRQIRNLQADLDLNRADIDRIRRKAAAILQKAASTRCPGMAPDNGVLADLDLYFPPID
jgi:hypothetical protein